MSNRITVAPLAVAILVCVMTSSLAQEQRLTTEVTIREESRAGGLSVSNALLSGNTLFYESCEAILFGEPTTATPLYEVKVSPDPNAGR